MIAKLFNVVNVEMLAGVVHNKDLVGFYAKVTEVDSQPKADYLGLADLFREPLKSILTTKHNYTMTVVEGKASIKMSNGVELGCAFFEELSKQRGKSLLADVSKLSPQIQSYFTTQIAEFQKMNTIQHAESVSQVQPVVQPTPQPVVKPQPVVQPTPVAQASVQPKPVAQAPANLMVETGRGTVQRRHGQVFSSDELKVGQFSIYSVLEPSIQLPMYAGLNANGEKIYGPEKLTEEECVALIQIQKLIDTTGQHLLSDKEIASINGMLDTEGKRTKASEKAQEEFDATANEGLIALYAVHGSIKQEVTKLRRANNNVIELRDNLQKSIADEDIPYELGTQRFSFKYMSFVDENGMTIEDTASPLLMQRVKQEMLDGQETTTPVPTKSKPVVTKPSTPIQPMPTQQAKPVAQAPKQITPVSSPFVGVASTPTPFAGGGAQPQASQKAAPSSAYIRKFLSTDGVTIEGIVFDISGNLPGKDKATGNTVLKPVSGTRINSLERLQKSFPSFTKQIDFKNADFIVEGGKLKVVMTDTQLNQIDIVPENRFVHPTEVENPKTIFPSDTKLTQMLETPKFERVQRVVEAPVVEVAPVVQPTPVVEVAPVVEVQGLGPITQNVQQFLDFLKTQNGVLALAGVVNGSVQTIQINTPELKAYLNI